MDSKTKKTAKQVGLPGEAFKPGPASSNSAPKAAPKLPTSLAVQEMGQRLTRHAEHLRELLSDLQTIHDQQWPIADPDHDGNLAQILAPFLEPIDYVTEAAGQEIVIDTTIASAIAELQQLADDINPGDSQGAWAREICGTRLEAPVPVGTPNRRKKTS
jgi:hypothetical protein